MAPARPRGGGWRIAWSYGCLRRRGIGCVKGFRSDSRLLEVGEDSDRKEGGWNEEHLCQIHLPLRARCARRPTRQVSVNGLTLPSRSTQAVFLRTRRPSEMELRSARAVVSGQLPCRLPSQPPCGPWTRSHLILLLRHRISVPTCNSTARSSNIASNERTWHRDEMLRDHPHHPLHV